MVRLREVVEERWWEAGGGTWARVSGNRERENGSGRGGKTREAHKQQRRTMHEGACVDRQCTVWCRHHKVMCIKSAVPHTEQHHGSHAVMLNPTAFASKERGRGGIGHTQTMQIRGSSKPRFASGVPLLSLFGQKGKSSHCTTF